jgi:thiol-disulfide isomerase/thioredoxin
MAVAVAAVIALGGCRREAAPAAQHQPAQQPPAAPAATQASATTPGSARPARPGARDDASPLALAVTTIDGKHWELATHRGHWVLVNFWATWCGPCLKEMPELSALDAMREQVDVIGLDYEDIAPADLRAFLAGHPVVYPVAIVDVYNPPAAFATPRGLPTTYLVGPDGRLARHFLGPVTAADIEAAIAAVSGAPPT